MKLSKSKTVITTIFILTFFVVGTGFASASNTVGQSVNNFLHLIISILSRVWIIIASLAGKLLTNDIVYMEFIHGDMALWKLRNITKNFMNFAIGGLFIWMVIKFLFVSQDSESNVAKNIVAFVVAGVAVQLSRFLVGAVIDLSTILTISVGSMPGTIISQDKEMQNTIREQTIRIPEKITLNLNDAPDQTLVSIKERIVGTTGYREIQLDDFIDTISPRHDSVAGPLVYIGASVFHVQDYLTRTQDMTTDTTDFSDLITTALIKFGILIMYTFAMIIIFVINIVRVVYIWAFIVLSPVLIGFYVLTKMGGDLIKFDGTVSGIGVVPVLKVIFAPVIYTVYMGLVLILVVTIQRIIGSNEFDGTRGNGDVNIKGNTVSVMNSSMTVIGDMRPSRKENTQSTISDLVLTVLTLVMLYGMVVLTVKTAPELVQKYAEKAKEIGNTALQQIPIGSTSVGGIAQFGEQSWNKMTQSGNMASIFGTQDDAKEIMDRLGFGDGIIGGKTLNDLKNSSINNTPEQFISDYNDFIEKNVASSSSPKMVKSFKNNQIKDPINEFLTKKTSRPGSPKAGKENRQQLLYSIDGSSNHTNSAKRIQAIESDKDIKVNDLESLLGAISKVVSTTSSPSQKKVLQDLFTKLTGVSDPNILKNITNSSNFISQKFK